MQGDQGMAAHLCVVPVTVERAVPLLALQGAVIWGGFAPQPAADPQGLLQIPGKHLPLLSPRLVVVHVVVLGAPVLVEQQCLYCHVLNHLHNTERNALSAACDMHVCLKFCKDHRISFKKQNQLKLDCKHWIIRYDYFPLFLESHNITTDTRLAS